MTFANPEYLYLLILLIPLILWYIFKERKQYAHYQFSSLKAFDVRKVNRWRVYTRHILFVLRLMALAILIVIIARPQSSRSWETQTTEGIDIVIALDISGSMLAQDFKPDRLEVAKETAIRFINNRPNDRIGMVVFSGESFTQCPLTTDHAALINLISDIKSGMITDGTAIGNGLATAVSRLKDSEAQSKVVILLTDGVNNAGEIDPITAGEIAHTFGIRIYTIGIGSMGEAPYPVQTPFGIQYQNMKTEIDEDLLRQIADLTDGKYFRATNKKALTEIYEQIDKLEKTKIEVKEFSRRNEEYLPFAIAAFVLVIVEFILRNSIFRTTP
ncbi:MAG TPA: VWA domain-containing protein [Salinivirgaceae bacterium]|nr:VWA domain-containing protein [Salinivirgaceae bacterium]